MRMVRAAGNRRASIGNQVIVDSASATVVKEVGHDIYDPVVYFPRADVDMDLLIPIDKSTHCPLKGDTEYFDIRIGETTVTEAAWSYVDMVAGAEPLQHLIAFDTRKVTIQ